MFDKITKHSTYWSIIFSFRDNVPQRPPAKMKVPPENTKELLGNMRAVQPSFLVITLCFVIYQPNEKVSMEKVLWNTFLLSSDTAEIHRGPPQAFSLTCVYVRLKTINVRWFMSVTQIETETIKCFLIVLLKKYVKANDISPGQFITYLLLNRPGTALQVDIRSWSLFVFLKMLYHWKYAVFVSTKNQLYCHFLWLSCQWWHIFFLSLPNQHFLQTRFA